MKNTGNKEVVKLSGDINFTRVVSIRRMGELKLSRHSSVQFDFSGVVQCDSSALVLLMAWKRFAKAEGVNVEFLHLPSSLTSLAAMCNIESMITS